MLSTIEFVLPPILSFLIVLILIPIIIKLAIRYNWVDQPNERKVHKQPIPRLGGVAIAIGMLIPQCYFLLTYPEFNLPMFFAILVLIGIGIWDDFVSLPAIFRLVIQFMLAGIIAAFAWRLESLYGILGIYELPIYFQYFITIFLIVAFINAFNFVDGIDGLAGGMGLIGTLFFAFLFYQLEQYYYAIWASTLAGAIIAFLYYNFNPAKIFMGDTGSTLLGFLLVIWGIKILDCNHSQIDTYNTLNLFVLVYAALLPPLFDISRTVGMRLLKGKHPFSADKTHTHHFLLQAQFNHKESMLLLCFANIFLIGLAYGLKDSFTVPQLIVCLTIVWFLLKESILLKKIINFQSELYKTNKSQASRD